MGIVTVMTVSLFMYYPYTSGKPSSLLLWDIYQLKLLGKTVTTVIEDSNRMAIVT